MKNIGPVMMPPGGAFVYDRNDEKVEHFTREGLIDALTELRVANHKKVGDPARDVDEYLSTGAGYSAPIAVPTERKTAQRPRLIDRVNSWLMTRYAKLSTIAYVSQVEAQRRAAICVRCPKNKDWRTSCPTCNAEAKREIERNIIVISQNKRTALHDRLKACSVAGHENRVAVFLDSTFLRHRVQYIDALPDHCWLKML